MLFCELGDTRVKPHSTSEPIKVGVLFSTTGITAAMETSMLNVTLLSIDQVNNAGGIDGRELVPVHYNPESDPDQYKEHADRLLTLDGAKIIFGCYMSSARKAVLPIVEKRNALLCYPAQYEGFEYSRNVIYCGAAPNQDSTQLGRYLLDHVGQRFYLVGSDYIWPLESSRIMREIVLECGGEIAGERYHKLDADRSVYQKLILDIKSKTPDVIFCNFVGESICHFYQAYARAGLDPSKMPIASLTTGETDIQAMGVAAGEGHITSAPYFQSVNTEENRKFVSKMKTRFGPDTVVDMCGEAAFFQVQIVADALRRTGTDDIDVLRPAILNTAFDAPQGRVRMDPRNAHTYLWPRVGRAKANGQFDILVESENAVRPDPYLTSFNPKDWSAKLAMRAEI